VGEPTLIAATAGAGWHCSAPMVVTCGRFTNAPGRRYDMLFREIDTIVDQVQVVHTAVNDSIECDAVGCNFHVVPILTMIKIPYGRG